MHPGIRSSASEHTDAVAFIAEMMRLERQVAQVARELNRIEAAMREALKARAKDRFEEPR